MKETFEDFASNTFWFWITTVVISVATGYIVNLYSNLTWSVIHAVVVLLLGALIYGISKPKEE